MTKFYLFTAEHDVEGSFGDLREYDTQAEALDAAVAFEEAHARPAGTTMAWPVPGWEWQIVEGTTLDQRSSEGVS